MTQSRPGAEGVEAPFTSDFSCADFALAHELGVEPIRQVLGACVFQVGYQSLMASGGQFSGMPAFGGGEGYVARLDVITQAWNLARERALSRLRAEAQEAGAEAVIGVKLRARAERLGEGAGAYAINYSVIGTAVAHRGDRDKARAGARKAPLVLTELSVADYSKLRRAGYAPLGIAAASISLFATYGYSSAMRMRPGSLGGGAFGAAGESFELREYSAALYAARDQARAGMLEAAAALGAGGIVGVRMDRSLSRPQLGGQATGLIVSLHAIGTAIAREGEQRRGARAEQAQGLAVKATIDLLHSG
jgi:uncharacterized protein YbjQ (UPF0145 family)